MLLDEYLAFAGVAGQENLSYLPQPNTTDIVLTHLEAPYEIVPTAFCFPFLRDGRVILANNRRRGAEIPGGHRDLIEGVLEIPSVAARREALEEVGAVVKHVTPVGFQRSHCTGSAPDGYKYPFPHSSQQFYTGFCEDLVPYVENDECLMPLLLHHAEVHSHLKERAFQLYLAARAKLFG
ncbi:NUDIX domain protein [compost metagenome]